MKCAVYDKTFANYSPKAFNTISIPSSTTVMSKMHALLLYLTLYELMDQINHTNEVIDISLTTHSNDNEI